MRDFELQAAYRREKSLKTLTIVRRWQISRVRAKTLFAQLTELLVEQNQGPSANMALSMRGLTALVSRH